MQRLVSCCDRLKGRLSNALSERDRFLEQAKTLGSHLGKMTEPGLQASLQERVTDADESQPVSDKVDTQMLPIAAPRVAPTNRTHTSTAYCPLIGKA